MIDKILKVRRYAKGDIRTSRKMTVSEILLRRLGTVESGARISAGRMKDSKKPVVYH